MIPIIIIIVKILTMTVQMIEAVTKMKSHLIPLNPPLNQKLKQDLLAQKNHHAIIMHKHNVFSVLEVRQKLLTLWCFHC